MYFDVPHNEKLPYTCKYICTYMYFDLAKNEKLPYIHASIYSIMYLYVF